MFQINAAVENVFATIAEQLGPVDLLVNNHGSFQAFGPIWECDPKPGGRMWRSICVAASTHAARQSPVMLARGKGRIVNLVGGGTGNSFPPCSGYASSKAAIMRLTECLNDTTVGNNVRTFAVDPGLVRTAMTEMQLTSEAGKRFLPRHPAAL